MFISITVFLNQGKSFIINHKYFIIAAKCSNNVGKNADVNKLNIHLKIKELKLMKMNE